MVDYPQSRGTQSGPLYLDPPRKEVTLRIEAASTAALAGVPDSTFQMLERWNSAAFLKYIRSP